MSTIDLLTDRLTNILDDELSVISNELEKLGDEIIEQLDTKGAITRQTEMHACDCHWHAHSILGRMQRLQEHVNLSSLDSLKDKVQNLESVINGIRKCAPTIEEED